MDDGCRWWRWLWLTLTINQSNEILLYVGSMDQIAMVQIVVVHRLGLHCRTGIIAAKQYHLSRKCNELFIYKIIMKKSLNCLERCGIWIGLVVVFFFDWYNINDIHSGERSHNSGSRRRTYIYTESNSHWKFSLSDGLLGVTFVITLSGIVMVTFNVLDIIVVLLGGTVLRLFLYPFRGCFNVLINWLRLENEGNDVWCWIWIKVVWY